MIAESDNLVEIADKYITFKYFETVIFTVLVGVLMVGGGYLCYKLVKKMI